jgi:hypothetical protein
MHKKLATILILCLILPWANAPSCLADIEDAAYNKRDEFIEKYTTLTKQILLVRIELETFNLNYRLNTYKQPKFRTLRSFVAQEAAAGAVLAFDCAGDDQYAKGIRNPRSINTKPLQGGLMATMIGASVAGADSGLELGSNAWLCLKNRRKGLDQHSATSFIQAKLKTINALLAQREALIAARPEHPIYARAVLEGKILRHLNRASLNEYSQFSSDARGQSVFTNSFYLLNVVTNALVATGAGYAYRSVKEPKFSGTGDILFIVAGGVGAVTPWLSRYLANKATQANERKLGRLLGQNKDADLAELAALRQQLSESVAIKELIASLPVTERLILYREANENFRTQLFSETAVTRRLEKVALEQSLLAPVIGGTLMTQGILYTAGYYRFHTQPKKQLSLTYGGTVAGTTGAALNVLATAASLLANRAYEHRLQREGRSPAQLIEVQLKHLDEVKAMVQRL